MHTVELLDQALQAALKMGFTIRQEWLEGSGGGGCQIRGRKHLFLDLSQSPLEQLEQVLDALRLEPALGQISLTAELRTRLAPPQAA